MKSFLMSTITAFAFFAISTTANAQLFNLSGPMDPLQAGTNGGFGAFDGSVSGAGDGIGAIFGIYDSDSNLLNYNLTWSDLTSQVTVAHFHLGAPGVSGSVQLAIPDTTSPSVGTDILLDQSQEDNLLAGDWYVNIHTDNFGGGEIRGQVLVTAVPEPASGAMGCLVCGGLLIRRRR